MFTCSKISPYDVINVRTFWDQEKVFSLILSVFLFMFNSTVVSNLSINLWSSCQSCLSDVYFSIYYTDILIFPLVFKFHHFFVSPCVFQNSLLNIEYKCKLKNIGDSTHPSLISVLRGICSDKLLLIQIFAICCQYSFLICLQFSFLLPNPMLLTIYKNWIWLALSNAPPISGACINIFDWL